MARELESWSPDGHSVLTATGVQGQARTVSDRSWSAASRSSARLADEAPDTILDMAQRASRESGVLLACFAVVFRLQPYSVTSPWSRFDEPGRRYVQAALRRDTAALQRLSASSDAVDWALLVGSTERGALAVWATSARASVGFTRRDTMDVWYDTPTDACPFRLTFVGQRALRVVRAHARCYFRRGWPSDPKVIDVSH